MKSVIWIGAFLGSIVGGAVPMLWGGSMLSISGFVFSGFGTIGGLYAGYRFWKHYWG
jgi:uncharacterized membrane protein